MFEKVKSFLIEELRVNPDAIKPEAELAGDLGINSLELAQLVFVCEEKFDIEITDRILIRCSHYFEEDVNNHQIKNIMLCGDAARRMLHIDDLKPYLDTVICENKTRRRYFVNYSPLVKYTNDEHFEVFKSHLLKYYNSITSKMYDYEIMII